MTRVAILWHMHQPFYRDPATHEHLLPWVRLHALKDYWGMVALLREHPSVKVTFNLVPSLLVQLDEFARNEARDRHLELGLKPAEHLTADERVFCVAEFFHAHQTWMIDPFPRYRELWARRAEAGDAPMAVRAARFSVDDLRDLQVWHKLAWVDPIYHATDARIQALVAKARGFSEEDKIVLRDVELEIIRRVVPEYAAAAHRGQVELSTSPFYHPILPLLCDSDVHRRTHPLAEGPREPFRHPDDAAEQLARAVAFHERTFGSRPRGVWPSEGSVSDAMVPLVRAAGFQWMATDEAILARTRGTHVSRDSDGNVGEPDVLYRPYRLGAEGADIACGFRDQRLSDLIGFTYASYPADVAADDFLRRVTEAGRRYADRTGGEEATIFVILDGENAWETYEGQGRPFLHALYARLGASTEVSTVTMSEACAPAVSRLPTIFPGSWINADFYVWIGHRDDHRAWDQLAAARRAITEASATRSPDACARAQDAILVAEGSDWFWWYGDDHSSAHDREFDDLFRRYLRRVYDELTLPAPSGLFLSNITTGDTVATPDAETERIEPRIDGEVTSYFEWMGAAHLDLHSPGGSMQAALGPGDFTRLEYGCGRDALFLRLDARGPVRALLEAGVEVRVTFTAPAGLRVRVWLQAGAALAEAESHDAGGWHALESFIPRAAANDILELAIPLAAVGGTEGIAFQISAAGGARDAGRELHASPVRLVGAQGRS